MGNLKTSLFIAASFAAGLAVAQEPGDVKIEKTSFTTNKDKVYEYELGTVYVPENRNRADSRTIGVGFIRFRSENPTAPPVFILPGGPGSSYLMRMKQSASNRAMMASEVDSFTPFCDVIYVDQRGYSEHGDVLTAQIEIPARPTDRALTEDDWIKAYERYAQRAIKKYEGTGVDLSGYTVLECAADVNDLRKALGYDKLMLNGTSFGSQWSFAVMRLFPETVSRAMLSGVEPINHGYDMPSHVFAALQRKWHVIDNQEDFAPYLPEGGMAEASRAVIERLEQDRYVFENEQGEVIATYGPLDFPWSNPVQILELYHGQTDRWRSQAERGFRAMSQDEAILGSLIDTSLGVTPARGHKLMSDPAGRYIGRTNFTPGLATAALWPTEDVGDDLRMPVMSDIPVVFAQGDWDTKTPIENTYEIAPYFTNSRVLVVERGGHGVFEPLRSNFPEVWAELVGFMRTGNLESIPPRVILNASRRFSAPRFDLPGR